MTQYRTASMLADDETEERPAVEQRLPLILEILPGQAGEGLIDIYEPGSYEQEPLRKLIFKSLASQEWSIEERQILDDVNRQLRGGKLLWRGHEIEGNATDYGVIEQTEAGEKYLYVPVRVIKPQEGGALRTQAELWSSR